ncbi:MAG TPA: hypothetical protein VGL25_19825, partial [Casimicrobiaceae bacterium]
KGACGASAKTRVARLSGGGGSTLAVARGTRSPTRFAPPEARAQRLIPLRNDSFARHNSGFAIMIE